MILSIRYFISGIVILFMLSACGGSGDGSGSGSGGGDDGQTGDSSPPLLVLRSVTNNSIITNQSNLPVIGTTSAQAEITVNGVATTVDANGNFSTTVNLSLGVNNITVIATQNSLQTTVQFSATLSQTPPALTVTGPAAALSTNNSNLAVTGSTDPSGVEVAINGVVQTLTTGNFSTNLTLSIGINLVRIVATDAAGNETVLERSVELDQTAPFLAVHSPIDGATTYIEPLFVSGETEPGTSVTVNGNPVSLSGGPGLPFFTEPLSTYETVSNVTIDATDPAGNSATINLSVNRIAQPGTLYVSNTDPNAADSGSCGSPAIPCLSIGQGLSRAQATAAPQVLVGSGIYPEQVSLVSGIHLFGGFNSDFTLRDLNTQRAEIWGDGSDSTIIASSVVTPTQLEGFVIRGPVMATPSSNSVALHIRDSDVSLQIRDNRIVAGRAADGTNGGNGGDGPDGTNGESGVIGIVFSSTCSIPFLNLGGEGGSTTVGSDNISGGNGGRHLACPNGSLSEISAGDGIGGQAGEGPNGGSAGGGGDAGDDSNLQTNTCNVSSEPRFGTAGVDGQPAGNGSAGEGGSGSSVNAGNWLGVDGMAGLNGTNGGGGGGGGAGGGALCSSGICDDRLGGTGGGGGAGGGRGVGGNGGGYGGASFGIFMTFSSTPSSLPSIGNNELLVGIGGDGGRGGDGGTGGNSGMGGPGGGLPGIGFCAGTGGDGGMGGAGGHGGGGGGGTGGPAVGIFMSLAGYTGIYSYDVDNTIDISTGIAGTGGNGGATLGNSGNAGANGSLSAIAAIP